MNWVEAEVSLAVSRAIGHDSDFPVIPILAHDAEGSKSLPAFARQFQSVRDVENDPQEWNRFLDAIRGTTNLLPETEPFFGLRAIDDSRSHLFFGRDDETRDISRIIAEQGILLVTGNSGSGKSSLLRAGLTRNWRGNEIGLLTGRRPGDCDWHVVTTHPGTDPFRLLAEGVEQAARDLGLSAADQRVFIGDIEKQQANAIRRGLRCGLDPDRTRTLLIIDQFEELLNPNIPNSVKQMFCDLLVALSDPHDRSVSVAMSMRSDYSNHLRNEPFQALFARLEANGRAARYLLDALSQNGLRDVVEKPLRLARHDSNDAQALGKLIQAEVGKRPGDLALIQFALTRSWDTRGNFDDNLVQAYAGVGRVEGALANEAERVYRQLLAAGHTEPVIAAAMIRLGSLSGAGLVRRVAPRHEFSDEGCVIVQFLASEDGNRLVQISSDDDRAEIAHEALLTQWERLDGWLQHAPEDKRTLDRLAERLATLAGAEQNAAGDRRKGFFDQIEDHFGLRVDRPARYVEGTDLAAFVELKRHQPDWLTPGESALIDDSAKYESELKARDDQQRRFLKLSLGGALYLTTVVTVVLIVLLVVWLSSRESERRAQKNLSAALMNLAEQRADKDDFENAAKLAIATLSTDIDAEILIRVRKILQSFVTTDAQIGVVLPLHRKWEWSWARRRARSVAISGDGSLIVSGADDGAVLLWDSATGEAIWELLRGKVDLWFSVAISGDGDWIASGGSDGTVQLWTWAGPIGAAMRGHQGWVSSVAVSGDGLRIVSGGEDSTVRLWDRVTGAQLRAPLRGGHVGWVRSVAISADGRRIASGGDDGTVRLWDGTTGGAIGSPLRGHQGRVWSVANSGDGDQIVSGGSDGTVRLWDWATLGPIGAPLRGHQGEVLSVAVSYQRP